MSRIFSSSATEEGFSCDWLRGYQYISGFLVASHFSAVEVPKRLERHRKIYTRIRRETRGPVRTLTAAPVVARFLFGNSLAGAATTAEADATGALPMTGAVGGAIRGPEGLIDLFTLVAKEGEFLCCAGFLAETTG